MRRPTRREVTLRKRCRGNVLTAAGEGEYEIDNVSPRSVEERRRQENATAHASLCCGTSHADGASKFSTLSRRLLKRWRNRQECVSEPPIARNDRESELIASLIQSGPIFRLIHWLVFVFRVSVSFRFVGFSHLLWQAAFFSLDGGLCVLPCVSMVEQWRFLSILRSVQIDFAIQRGSRVSNRGPTIRAGNLAHLRAAESFCSVAEGIEELSSERSCGSGFLNSQTLRKIRRVEILNVRVRRLHQFEHEYPDSIYTDEQELLSQRAQEWRDRRYERIHRRSTPFVRKPVYPRHVIEGDGETALVAFRTPPASA